MRSLRCWSSRMAGKWASLDQRSIRQILPVQMQNIERIEHNLVLKPRC